MACWHISSLSLLIILCKVCLSCLFTFEWPEKVFRYRQIHIALIQHLTLLLINELWMKFTCCSFAFSEWEILEGTWSINCVQNDIYTKTLSPIILNRTTRAEHTHLSTYYSILQALTYSLVYIIRNFTTHFSWNGCKYKTKKQSHHRGEIKLMQRKTEKLTDKQNSESCVTTC